MKSNKKKALVMNECKSPYIAQAIFILREGVCEYESGVLADAERIVAGYMGNTPEEEKEIKKKHKTVAILASVGIMLSVCAVIFIKLH